MKELRNLEDWEHWEFEVQAFDSIIFSKFVW